MPHHQRSSTETQPNKKEFQKIQSPSIVSSKMQKPDRPENRPMKLSVMYPTMVAAMPSAESYALRVAQKQLSRLWIGSSFYLGELVVLSILADRVPGVALGTAVSLAPMHNRYEVALTARSIAATSGQQFSLGLGAGSPALRNAVCREPRESPSAYMADYVRDLKNSLSPVELPRPAATLKHPTLIGPGVEVVVGALRPAMCAAVSGTADAIVTWMANPRYIEAVLQPALKRGATATGLAVPPRVIAVVHCAISRTGRVATQFVFSALKHHLSSPHYIEMLRTAQVDLSSTDLNTNLNCLLDNRIFWFTDPKGLREMVTAYAVAGVDEIALNISGTLLVEGPDAALDELDEIIDVLSPLVGLEE